MNPFLRMITEMGKKVAPEMFHPCPFSGVHKIQNSTLNRQFATILPAGKYRAKTTQSDEVGDFAISVLDFELS